MVSVSLLVLIEARNNIYQLLAERVRDIVAMPDQSHGKVSIRLNSVLYYL